LFVGNGGDDEKHTAGIGSTAAELAAEGRRRSAI